MHATIRLDVSTTSVVVTCTACPWWSAFAWTREEGWAAGARHQTAAHATPHGNARAALDATRSRARDTPTA